jgi:hypothetical protein
MLHSRIAASDDVFEYREERQVYDVQAIILLSIRGQS